jgi:hypothetical protein
MKTESILAVVLAAIFLIGMFTIFRDKVYQTAKCTEQAIAAKYSATEVRLICR